MPRSCYDRDGTDTRIICICTRGTLERMTQGPSFTTATSLSVSAMTPLLCQLMSNCPTVCTGDQGEAAIEMLKPQLTHHSSSIAIKGHFVWSLLVRCCWVSIEFFIGLAGVCTKLHLSSFFTRNASIVRPSWV